MRSSAGRVLAAFLCASPLLLRAGLLRADPLAERRPPGMPDPEWSVGPAEVRQGEDVLVRVRPFAQGEWTCRVNFLLRVEISPPFRCGDEAAEISLPAPRLRAPTDLSVALGYCAGPPRPLDERSRCWAEVSKILVRPAPRRRGGRAGAAPRPAPAPAGRGSYTAVAAEPDEGEAVEAERLEELLDREQTFAGLDGRTYLARRDKDSFDDKNRKFRLALMQDEGIRDGYDYWGRLDSDERLGVLRRTAELYGKVFGVPSPRVELAALEPDRVGLFEGGTIRLDPSKSAFRDRDEAFGVLAHEATHHYQHRMVERLEAGTLRTGSEEEARAKEWAAELESYCCEHCERRCDYASYRGQAVERDAFDVEEAVTWQLRSKKSRGAYEEYLNAR